MPNQETPVTVFRASYVIGNELSGGYTFHTNLYVDTVNKKVYGSGNISQATYPPTNIPTTLNGDYSPLLGEYNILIVAEGTNPIIPIIPPQKNVSLKLFLDENWETGTANYSFYNGQQWVELRNQKVQLVTSESNEKVDNIKELATTVTNQEKELVAAQAK